VEIFNPSYQEAKVRGLVNKLETLSEKLLEKENTGIGGSCL
jgi:hypothetical protein